MIANRQTASDKSSQFSDKSRSQPAENSTGQRAQPGKIKMVYPNQPCQRSQ